MYKKIIGGFLVILSISIFASVLYRNSKKSATPIIFSEHATLDALWNYHKQYFLDQTNGRTYDATRNDATTSEGEAYTMLRAVWWGDKTTFDRSWTWTKANLQHTSNDHLFSWYYGKMANGNYGVNSSIGGNNTASDADTDIALALIFAHDRWGDQTYLDSAKQIIPDIWANEVAVINGKPYMTADNIEKFSAENTAVLNPSYFAPYAYKIFAKYDQNSNDDWKGLTDNSYTFIENASKFAPAKQKSANVPPDWILIDKKTGALQAPDPNVQKGLSMNYSYDAMRVPFRMYLDWYWFKDQRALNVLKSFSFLSDQWQQHQAIYTTYAHDGSIIKQEEAPAIYGGNLGYFMAVNPDQAKQIYENKLKTLFSPDSNAWNTKLNYYDDAWGWFGLALYNNALTNLDQ